MLRLFVADARGFPAAAQDIAAASVLEGVDAPEGTARGEPDGLTVKGHPAHLSASRSEKRMLTVCASIVIDRPFID
jgi:hypothetical protein